MKSWHVFFSLPAALFFLRITGLMEFSSSWALFTFYTKKKGLSGYPKENTTKHKPRDLYCIKLYTIKYVYADLKKHIAYIYIAISKIPIPNNQFIE